ncbi:MAG TPA: hypothetical protein ENL18_02435 [Thermoplasmatales archaeon]|nr:hypothetical protein [Thermoplasmatales archaeon]
MTGRARRDRITIELIILLLIFMVLYVFSSDLVGLMEYAGNAMSDVKPAEAFFMFFAYVFGLFADFRADVILYLIGGGIVILNGRRG